MKSVEFCPHQFIEIRSRMKCKTAKQKLVKKNFKLDETERAMLTELKELLEMFEFVTNEFQCN